MTLNVSFVTVQVNTHGQVQEWTGQALETLTILHTHRKWQLCFVDNSYTHGHIGTYYSTHVKCMMKCMIHAAVKSAAMHAHSKVDLN